VATTTDCYTKAQELLARRPHFRRELAVKLASRSFSDEEIESALTRLAEQGYLDDLEHALDLARGSLQRKGYGPRRLRYELDRRGAPEKVVDEVVEAVMADGELVPARRVAARWLSRGNRDRQALARHLDRKGYSTGVILQVLEESEREQSWYLERSDRQQTPSGDDDEQ
jgi:regulatory protein